MNNFQFLIATASVETKKSVDVTTPTRTLRIWAGSRLAVPSAKPNMFDIATVVSIESGSIMLRRDRMRNTERLRLTGGAIPVDVYPVVMLTQQKPGQHFDYDSVQEIATDTDPLRAILRSPAALKYDEYGATMLLHALNCLAFDGMLSGVPVILASSSKLNKARGVASCKVMDTGTSLYLEPQHIMLQPGLNGRMLVFVLAHEAAHLATALRFYQDTTEQEIKDYQLDGGHGPQFMSFRKSLAPWGIPLTRYVVYSIPAKQNMEIGYGTEFVVLASPADSYLYMTRIYPNDTYGASKVLADQQAWEDRGYATLRFRVQSNNLLHVLGIDPGVERPVDALSIKALREHAIDVVETPGTNIQVSSIGNVHNGYVTTE